MRAAADREKENNSIVVSGRERANLSTLFPKFFFDTCGSTKRFRFETDCCGERCGRSLTLERRKASKKREHCENAKQLLWPLRLNRSSSFVITFFCQR